MGTATEAITGPLPAAEHDRWRPTAAGWAARVGVLVAIFGGVVWVTATVPQYWADRISLAAIYAVIGLSLNIVLGYIGQVSLGHHGFVGIAAFVAAYFVSEKMGCTPQLGCGLDHFGGALFLAVLSGGLAAMLLGLVALRIRGLYLALITLAYGFMAERVIFEIPFLTRGGAGMPAPRPDGFTSDRAYAYLTLIFLVLVIYVDWRLVRSKVGRAILSIKHSEPVAASYGVNVTGYKVLAFIVSGLFAGLAGGLFAFRNLNVTSPDFNFSIALLWVLMVVVGGLGNRTGVVCISAFFALFPFLAELITPLERFVSGTYGRSLSQVALVFGALLAILTIVQFQGGFAEQISPITRWLRGQRFSMHPEGHGPPPKEGAAKHALMAKLGLHKKSEPHAATDESASVEPGSQAVGPSEEQPEEQPTPAGARREDS
jgi:branched-chain amino acid transport system permease protein